MYRHNIYLNKDDIYCYSFDLTLPYRLRIGDQISSECMQYDAQLAGSVDDDIEKLDRYFETYDRFLVSDAVIEGMDEMTITVIPVRTGQKIQQLN